LHWAACKNRAVVALGSMHWAACILFKEVEASRCCTGQHALGSMHPIQRGRGRPLLHWAACKNVVALGSMQERCCTGQHARTLLHRAACKNRATAKHISCCVCAPGVQVQTWLVFVCVLLGCKGCGAGQSGVRAGGRLEPLANDAHIIRLDYVAVSAERGRIS